MLSPLLAAASCRAVFEPFLTVKFILSQFSDCHLFLYSVFPAIYITRFLKSCTFSIVFIISQKSILRKICLFYILKSCARYDLILSEVKERNLTAGIRKEERNTEPMTNEQAKMLERLVRENEKQKRKIKKLKKKLKKLTK